MIREFLLAVFVAVQTENSVSAQNVSVHIYDTMVIILPNNSSATRDTVLERIRQVWDVSLKPEIAKVQMSLLVDSPFFTQKFTDDGLPYLFLDGLPKPLMRNGSLTSSRPMVMTDSIEITATGRAQRDKIMDDIKQVWEKIAASANITHLQLEILSDRPSDAYATTEGVPIRNIAYKLAATANTDFDEVVLKNEFRLQLNATAIRNLWKIPEFIIPGFANGTATTTTTSQPKFTGLPFASPRLRNVVLRISGEATASINIPDAKRRFRKLVSAFPVEGLWFISEEDAEAAAVDEIVQEIPVNIVIVNVTQSCNYTCPSVMITDEIFFHNTTSFPVFNATDETDNVTVKYSVPVAKEMLQSQDYGTSFLMINNLIDTMGKLTDMSSRMFKRMFQY